MRKPVFISVGVIVAVIVATAATLPIIRPRYFCWTRGGSLVELNIRGILTPHGGKRGFHCDTFLGLDARVRICALNLAFVAWEFELSQPHAKPEA
jgi:hypothetical protein